MILLYLSDSGRNPFKNLMYEEEQPDNLNTIPLIANSTEKKPCTWIFIKNPVHIARISEKRILIIKSHKLLLYNNLYNFIGGGMKKRLVSE